VIAEGSVGRLPAPAPGWLDIHERRDIGLTGELAYMRRVPADETPDIGGPILLRQLGYNRFPQPFHGSFIDSLRFASGITCCSQLCTRFVGRHAESVTHRWAHVNQCNRARQPKP
jgi:hypothetical protein